jgi:hypothetical protein
MFTAFANEPSYCICDDYATPAWQKLTRGRVAAELWGAPLEPIFSIAKAQGGRKRCVFVVKLTASIYLPVQEQSEKYLQSCRTFLLAEIPEAVNRN